MGWLAGTVQQGEELVCYKKEEGLEVEEVTAAVAVVIVPCVRVAGPSRTLATLGILQKAFGLLNHIEPS